MAKRKQPVRVGEPDPAQIVMPGVQPVSLGERPQWQAYPIRRSDALMVFSLIGLRRVYGAGPVGRQHTALLQHVRANPRRAQRLLRHP